MLTVCHKIYAISGMLLLLILASACSGKTYQAMPPPPVQRPMAPQPIGPLVKYPPAQPKKEPFAARETAPKSLIIIDPGHGGEDFGTQSHTSPKYHEKSLNLATSFILRDYLQKLGYEVSLTRANDKFIALSKRADFANLQEPSLFVSVHYNSAPSKEAEGVEVYYYRSETDKARTAESKLLAESILQRVIKNTDAKSRGIKHGNFAVIRETQMPAVLVEGGFLTSDNEMNRLKDGTYIKRIAWGIAEGINNYLQGQEG